MSTQRSPSSAIRHLGLALAALSLAAGGARAAERTGTAEPNAQISLVWLTWGNVREEWIVPAGGGIAHWRQPPGQARDFAVSKADFDRIRAQFKAFEGVPFQCERVVYDMPYGRVVWSGPGLPDQTLQFDLGCVTGDADAVLESVEAATALLVEMRDRAD
jgi:hypothetical protein